ncbi:hypothetical protein R1sor_006926 [Riccia sorocarpa]|uniref:Uncharacterized protein n=1 Tax=Riccia sorocarpa TaxID=122646 RepID=A0ABD3HT57_9MARC
MNRLTEDVKKLQRQKVALAVGVRAAVSWEGDRVLGVFAENEELKEEISLLRSDVKRPTDTFLLRTLYPWLEKFTKWKGDTISFVQAHGREIQTVDSWDSLTQYWGAPLLEDLNFMFSSLPRRQQTQLLNEYHAKLAESIRQTELDVKAALEAQKEITRKEHEEALKQTELQETEGTSASRRALIPQPKDLVNILDKTELLLAAVRDEEMEEMGGK